MTEFDSTADAVAPPAPHVGIPALEVHPLHRRTVSNECSIGIRSLIGDTP